MPVEIRDRGEYELFETTHGHRILVLNRERWFAWIEGDEGEILVRSDPDYEAPGAVLDQIEKIGTERRLEDMADVMAAIGEARDRAEASGRS